MHIQIRLYIDSPTSVVYLVDLKLELARSLGGVCDTQRLKLS